MPSLFLFVWSQRLLNGNPGKLQGLVGPCDAFANQLIVAANLQVHFKCGSSRKCKKKVDLLQFVDCGFERKSGELMTKKLGRTFTMCHIRC